MNAEDTLKALELAHQILQVNIMDKEGCLAVNDKFFEGLDQVLERLAETREFAETMR